ncbi:MAG TPA: hypothetical protein ENJ80_07195 [Gammaproteobacteria bacterium]|nr:hypothetical protein [Gammaproteobacteria bacterium]
MSDIGQLPPASRVPPGLPGKGVGQDDKAPQRKPDKEQQRQQERRRKRGQDDDAPIIDEYA